MSKAIIIDVQSETAGIVVGSTGNFRFFSAPFHALGLLPKPVTIASAMRRIGS